MKYVLPEPVDSITTRSIAIYFNYSTTQYVIYKRYIYENGVGMYGTKTSKSNHYLVHTTQVSSLSPQGMK